MKLIHFCFWDNCVSDYCTSAHFKEHFWKKMILHSSCSQPKQKKMQHKEEAESKWTWPLLLLEQHSLLQILPAAPTDICSACFGQKSGQLSKTQTASISMQQPTQPHRLHWMPSNTLQQKGPRLKKPPFLFPNLCSTLPEALKRHFLSLVKIK